MSRKRPPSQPRIVVREDQRRLLSYLKTCASRRDYTLVLLCLRTGLSTSEVVGLNVGHIFREDVVVSVLRISADIAKNRISRKLPLDEEIREKGFSRDDEELAYGLRCIAAPVFDHNDRPSYAISLSGPSMRMTDDRVRAMQPKIQQVCRRLSQKLRSKPFSENQN